MQRTIDIEVSLNGLQVQNKPLFCQGDTDTHFLNIRFMNDVELTGYALQVYYLPPYPCVVPYVDLFSEVTSNPFKVPIPDKILERNGEVKVEFVLSKEPELITINKTFNFEVVRTLNGTSVTAIPEGTLKETIAQQIEKIKKLLAESQNKIHLENGGIPTVVIGIPVRYTHSHYGFISYDDYIETVKLVKAIAENITKDIIESL